jgi:hypothetical protein
MGACLLFLATGCTKHVGLTPEGQLLKNGIPFVPEEGEFVLVSFIAAADSGNTEGGSYVASFNPQTSTFKVGGSGKLMPPGKYKIAIQVNKQHKDTLHGQFGPATTPFVFDIQTGKEEIKVDLATTPGAAPTGPVRRKEK